MKIVKAGNINWDKPWVGKEMCCGKCGCVFVPGEDDKVNSDDDHRGPSYWLNCPTCGQPVYCRVPSCSDHYDR